MVAHHDGITGTARQRVAFDYINKLNTVVGTSKSIIADMTTILLLNTEQDNNDTTIDNNTNNKDKQEGEEAGGGGFLSNIWGAKQEEKKNKIEESQPPLKFSAGEHFFSFDDKSRIYAGTQFIPSSFKLIIIHKTNSFLIFYQYSCIPKLFGLE